MTTFSENGNDFVGSLLHEGRGLAYSCRTFHRPTPKDHADSDVSCSKTVCVSLFYVNDTGSIGSRGRTVGIPYIYPSP